MANRTATAPTIGSIARQLSAPIHRVEYVIKSRHIQPVSRAGSLRIFDEDAVERVAVAIREIDARRTGGAACNP
jgi:hypothetical protein